MILDPAIGFREDVLPTEVTGCSEQNLADLIWMPNYRALGSYLTSLGSRLRIYKIRMR